jgi:divalent metal cation (Fe/Co/Zn/Cd) transporter
MNFVLRYLELLFTVAGLAVIFGVTALIHPADTSPWAVAAVTAIAVGVIHGVLFWFVRHRQREVRRATLEETERMLRDVVINQLAIIRMSVDLQGTAASREPQLALQRVEGAIGVINSALINLSEESLSRWHARYAPSPAPR